MRPSPRPRDTSPARPPLTPKQIYLIAYNFLSFVLWYTILIRVAYPFVMLPALNAFSDGVESAPFKDSAAFHPGGATPSTTGVPATSVQGVVAETYSNTGDYVRYIQTLAGLEVLHALVGLVRAPVATTAMQVASRFLLVWGVLPLFGKQMLAPLADLGFGEAAKEVVMGVGQQAKSWNQIAYVGMLVAHSVTECVRYGYFVFFLAGAKMPAALSWMR